MARKFVTLNHHSGDDYLNADVSWTYINKFYIDGITTTISVMPLFPPPIL